MTYIYILLLLLLLLFVYVYTCTHLHTYLCKNLCWFYSSKFLILINAHERLILHTGLNKLLNIVLYILGVHAVAIV